MQDTYCERFGLTKEKRKQRLALLQLDTDESSIADHLHNAILFPCHEEIINVFYAELAKHDEVNSKLGDKKVRARLKLTMQDYLKTLGVGFNTEDYFERRLHIGLVHSWIGINLSLYQCAYRLLQQTIIDHIGEDDPRKPELIRFLMKITTLDMSLAIEAYHDSQMSSLEKFVDVERDRADILMEKMRHDNLTSIYTRESILDFLDNCYSVYQQARVPFCVAMVDIDHFKKTNDNYGHLVGDEVLKGVAQRIKSGLRHGDAVGRYGGEEFLVVLGHAGINEAMSIALRIKNNVASAPFKVVKESVVTTISIGVAEIAHGETVLSLIDRADQAMYRAKQNGRNRVER